MLQAKHHPDYQPSHPSTLGLNISYYGPHMIVMQEFRLPTDRKWEICFKERYTVSACLQNCHSIETSHQDGCRHSVQKEGKDAYSLLFIAYHIYIMDNLGRGHDQILYRAVSLSL